MKKILFAAAACLLAIACKPEEGETTASLEVSPSSLTFGAEDTTPQEIAVTATNTEWTYILSEAGKEWISINDGQEGKLLVSVAANPKAEPRTASIVFRATDNKRVKDRSVTVTQQGSENPEVYALTVDPASLTFAAEKAEAQSVKVTATGSGITWSAAVEDAAKEWINLSAEEGAEGETTLTVTVQDNPDTAERSANIILTPSEESVGPKAVRVTQEAKVLPPSLSISYEDGEVPEEGFSFDYRGHVQGGLTTIDIEAVNISWNATVSYDTGASNWVTLFPHQSETKNHVQFRVAENAEAEPRSCRLVISTDTEGIGPFEIAIRQEGKPEFLSTITEDTDFGTLTNSYVIVKPYKEGQEKTYTIWDMRFWSDDVTFDGREYTGTGDRLCIYVASDPIAANDQGEYYLPEGTYDAVANFGYDKDPLPRTISGGKEYYNPTFPSGSWFHKIENGEYPDRICITGGTMTVTRTGNSYTLTFSFISDAKYNLTGSFEGTFEQYAN